jgi:hypothetical protein
MMWWISPLSREAEEMLSKERAFEAAPADVRGRALARARTALRDVDAFTARLSLPRRPGFMAAAVVLAVAAVSFAAWRNWPKKPAPVPAVTQPAPSSSAKSSLGVSPPAVPTSEPASAAEHSNSPLSEPPAKREAVAAQSASSAADAYALELKILERARAAAARGDFSAALRAISNHQQRFPAGRLQEEREALRVKALSGLGRADEASRAAERFRERFPRSVLSQPQ